MLGRALHAVDADGVELAALDRTIDFRAQRRRDVHLEEAVADGADPVVEASLRLDPVGRPGLDDPAVVLAVMALPSAIDVDHRFPSLLGGWRRVNPYAGLACCRAAATSGSDLLQQRHQRGRSGDVRGMAGIDLEIAPAVGTRPRFRTWGEAGRRHRPVPSPRAVDVAPRQMERAGCPPSLNLPLRTSEREACGFTPRRPAIRHRLAKRPEASGLGGIAPAVAARRGRARGSATAGLPGRGGQATTSHPRARRRRDRRSSRCASGTRSAAPVTTMPP